MFFEGLTAAVFSQLVYRYIIPNKRSTTAYLIGYGFIIPFWLIFPSRVLEYLDVRNKIFRFCIAAVTPALSVFRTTEGKTAAFLPVNALFGVGPTHALFAPVLLFYEISYAWLRPRTFCAVCQSIHDLLRVAHGSQIRQSDKGIRQGFS